MLDYKSIGRRIAFYRRKAGISQGVLAEKLDISDGYVSQIECGSAKVSLARLDEISDILNVDIAYLLSDKVIDSSSVVNTEVYEIINNWSKEKVNMLIELLNCVDGYFNK